jgi:hypothetical protein
LVERGPEKAGVASPILALGTTNIAQRLPIASILNCSALAFRHESMGPSAIHESGHFYFAQTGHSHFAATAFAPSLTLTAQHKIRGSA